MVGWSPLVHRNLLGSTDPTPALYLSIRRPLSDPPPVDVPVLPADKLSRDAVRAKKAGGSFIDVSQLAQWLNSVRQEILTYELQDGPATSLLSLPHHLSNPSLSAECTTVLRPFRNFEFIAEAPQVNVSTTGAGSSRPDMFVSIEMGGKVPRVWGPGRGRGRGQGSQKPVQPPSHTPSPHMQLPLTPLPSTPVPRPPGPRIGSLV